MAVLKVAVMLVAFAMSCPLIVSGAVLATVRDVRTTDRPADVIMVLGGERPERVGAAARLFREGRARALLVSGAGDCEANSASLRGAGIASASIWRDCASQSTWQNLAYARAWFRARGVRRIIVVTSWYHVARAAFCVRALLPGLRVAFAPVSRSDEPPWSWFIASRLASEYLKLVWYIAAAPFRAGRDVAAPAGGPPVALGLDL